MTRMLGRRPPKNARALRLAPLLTGVVPQHPTSADHFAEVRSWILGGNDRYGDCGPVSVANDRLLVTTYLTGRTAPPTQADIFDLYRRSGNPGFDPNDPGGPGDGGVDMQTMCEALVAGGVGGTKALAFAKVDHTNLDEVRAAICIFGSVLLGVDLEDAQRTQTDNGGPWDYVRSGEWGGHAVLAGRYTGATSGTDIGVVTWAKVMGTTDQFEQHQLGEAWVVVWPEHLGSAAFTQGMDVATLAADYQAITGRPFPGPPTPPPSPRPPGPAPGPGPHPDPADVALAAALGPWALRPHVGVNRFAALAFESWKTAKRL